MLQGLARERVFRERGLLARFLFAIPPPVIGARTFDGPTVPDAVRARYVETVLWLCRWPGQAVPLTLTPEAFETWRAYALDVEREQAPGGGYATILDWTGKLPGLVARLAGILHAVAGATVGRIGATVDAGTMRAAVDLGGYAAAHALAAFGMMGADPALDGALSLLEWLKRARLKTFTTRDAYRENRTLTPPSARLALDALAERGWIQRSMDGERNGRPSERWAVHPHLVGDAGV